VAEATIVVEDIEHVFGGAVMALSRTSLSVASGEFVSVVGPSGCGKTTLLNLIAGLIEVQSGRVLVAGAPPRAGRHDIAYMLARDSLYPWLTAQRNAELGNELRGMPSGERAERAQRLLGAVGLTGFASAYPKQLSQGMRQRVALARTFAMPSHILLMDEPFGALDAQTKLQLEDLLLELWQDEQRTVLFVTHDLAEAVVLSDRVMVMSARPGRIVADIGIDLPRPRSVCALQTDTRFHEIYSDVWAKLEETLGHGGIA